jgi:hypothetical protein
MQLGKSNYYYLRSENLAAGLHRLANHIEHTEIEFLCNPSRFYTETQWDPELELWHITLYYDEEHEVTIPD